MATGLEPFKKDQFQGAVSTVYAATTVKDGGNYICPPAVFEPGSEQSQDEGLADDLMHLTQEIIAEKTKHDSVEQGCPLRLQ